jgi:hypothetical protein
VFPYRGYVKRGGLQTSYHHHDARKSSEERSLATWVWRVHFVGSPVLGVSGYLEVSVKSPQFGEEDGWGEQRAVFTYVGMLNGAVYPPWGSDRMQSSSHHLSATLMAPPRGTGTQYQALPEKVGEIRCQLRNSLYL